MTRRSKLLAAMLAVLVVLFALVLSGCAGERNVFTRTQDGRLEYKEGNNVWTLDNKGGSTQIMLNDRLFAILQNRVAQFSLPGGRSLDVTLDADGTPISVKTAWNVQLTQQDYDQMNTAFYFKKNAGAQPQSSSLGWGLIMLLVIAAGVLLFFYAGPLVNTAKAGGIFSGYDTAKTLLIFRAAGIFVIVVAAVILLAIIF